MAQENRGAFEALGADPSQELNAAGLSQGDEIAFNPPGDQDPEVREVRRSDEMLTGTEIQLEGGDIVMGGDLNDPDTTRVAPLVDAGPELRQIGIERQEPTGRFAPPNTRPDSSVPPDRGPNGKFVSPEREPLDDIGRREDDGLFDLF